MSAGNRSLPSPGRGSPFGGLGNVASALAGKPQYQQPASDPFTPQVQPVPGPTIGGPTLVSQPPNDVQRQQMQQYRDYQQEQFGNWQRQQAPIYENVDSIDVGITGVGGRREAAPMSLQEMRGLWRRGNWR